MGNQQGQHRSGWVAVPHARIYWEASGNPAGIPVLYLHGGPGSSLGSGGYRRRHDPSRFFTVGIDQRGCGRSTPVVQDDLAHLHLNTTQQLIEDIEAVRAELGFPAWIVTGLSWGSTLAMAYALRHPDRVLGLAMAAVTTTSRAEIDWITGDVGRFCPKALEEFIRDARALPYERTVEAYARRLAGPDRTDALAAALAWDRWESAVAALETAGPAGSKTSASAAPRFDGERSLVSFALLVTRYWAQDGFLPGAEAILPRIYELNGIPARLIHGRKDVGSPVDTACKLHRLWPSSRLTVIDGEGHVGPKGLAALAGAVEEMSAELGSRGRSWRI
ncbi:alpha/beta fold hydrolase [Arthrobacter sp. zg-Y40]|uniref:alpha/beta fold hydrolase n=1 Tax=Arthrobacter sp. zg-Y40 TaxID=2886939 RepID=UPI001D142CDF|nr:alpha/beta fold hydrolase [Arthrobacter sp. zg-Y40]MCC3279417.1 alpha/beta fold hydrolase [Arthrobacter sp. zg-Y40]